MTKRENQPWPPSDQAAHTRRFFAIGGPLFGALSVLAGIFLLVQGGDVWAIAALACGVMGLALGARWVSLSAERSKSPGLRALERLRSYLANEPASFEKHEQVSKR